MAIIIVVPLVFLFSIIGYKLGEASVYKLMLTCDDNSFIVLYANIIKRRIDLKEHKEKLKKEL